MRTVSLVYTIYLSFLPIKICLSLYVMLALNASTANSFFPYFTKMEARVEESECAQEETHWQDPQPNPSTEMCQLRRMLI